MNVIIYDLPERAEQEYTDEREAGADEITALTAAARIATADELRALIKASEDAGYQDVHAVMTLLRVRAAGLDPDGAQ